MQSALRRLGELQITAKNEPGSSTWQAGVRSTLPVAEALTMVGKSAQAGHDVLEFPVALLRRISGQI
jgi:hypothetical protein